MNNNLLKKIIQKVDLNELKEKYEELQKVLKETENSLRCANLRIMELEKENKLLTILCQQSEDDDDDDYDSPIKVGLDPTDLD